MNFEKKTDSQAQDITKCPNIHETSLSQEADSHRACELLQNIVATGECLPIESI